jgi:hypothetical protein
MQVKNRQTLFDIAITQYGSIEGVLLLSIDNDISITDELVPGHQLLVNNSLSLNRSVTTYYKANETSPATELTESEEIDFKIFDDTFNDTFN